MDLRANWVRSIRNQGNIGLVANILRCIETAESEYVWVLGDDDVVEDDALEAIRTAIKQNPDACFFNFASVWSGERREEKKLTGLASYVANVENISGQIFISSCVFHVPTFLRYLRFAYHGIYSAAGFLSPIFLGLNVGGKAVISPKKLVTWGDNPGDSWNPFPIWKGIMTLLELPCDWDRATFERLAKLISDFMIPGGRSLITAFLRNSPAMSSIQKKYVFRQLLERSSLAKTENLQGRFYRITLHLLVRAPDFLIEFLSKKIPPRPNQPSHFDTYRRL